MPIKEAKRLCPDLILVPQKPDLYRRAHNALLCEIETVIAIDTAKSIDELTCVLDDSGKRDPELLAARIKSAISNNIGQFITCSIGFAANRQLAKIACKAGKEETKRRGSYGNGLAIWWPTIMPDPLLRVELEDIPGVGSNMAKRLYRNGVFTTTQLYALQPKHMRKIWNSVNGERLWYALHGYDIQAPSQQRGMFGHGRVLPPDARSITGAYEISRLLLTKAARRLRRENFYAAGLWLWLSVRDGSWFGKHYLPVVNDDQAILSALRLLWQRVREDHPRGVTIFRVGVTLYDLSPADERQMDMLNNDDAERQKWEKANNAVDAINSKYSGTIVSMGNGSHQQAATLAARSVTHASRPQKTSGETMGNWKSTIKVRDLDDEQRLELTCKKCGRVTYATKQLLCEGTDRSQKYLDEIEAKVRCKARAVTVICAWPW